MPENTDDAGGSAERPLKDKFSRRRAIMRWILAAFFTAAGIAHLMAPDALLFITPSWVPFAPLVITLTGLCEIAGSVALVTGYIALAIYALCVWPANFKHAGIAIAHISNSWLYHGPRLAFQPVIMWWALYCAEVIDWPWRGSRCARPFRRSSPDAR